MRLLLFAEMTRRTMKNASVGLPSRNLPPWLPQVSPSLASSTIPALAAAVMLPQCGGAPIELPPQGARPWASAIGGATDFQHRPSAPRGLFAVYGEVASIGLPPQGAQP